MKQCLTCKQEKPREAFSKDRTRKDGLQNQCKSCTREYRKANREAILAYKKAIYEATRARAVADRGGACAHCGRVECTDGLGKFVKLHFHHTGRKNFTLAHRFHCGWDFVKDEVALTILLCWGCHIKEHKRRAKKARESREAA